MNHAGSSKEDHSLLATEPNRPDTTRQQIGRGRRRTIAVLIDELDHQIGGYEGLLRAALNSECARFDLNQYLVVGRAIDPSEPKNRAHNSVYNLIASQCVEGVIVISGGLSNCLGTGVVKDLCEQYRPLPMCSLGLQIPGIPSIVAENRSAMRSLVEHLVLEHKLRDFAFIGGPLENPDAKIRREVFEEVLLRHGLPANEELIASGQFTPPGGEEAVYKLISTGQKIDAIVCANDAMALGALEALRALGHHVPRDVILTGFDDVIQSRISSPAITTVRQPLDQMAALAVRLVFEQISGGEVPGLVDLPCEFVPRKSCGCGGFALERSIQPPHVVAMAPADYVLSMSPRLVRLLERAVRVHRNVFADWAAPLVESLVLELGGQKEIFLSTLEELLDRTAIRNDIFEDFQAAVTLLRDELSQIVSPDLEALWHDARRLIAVSNTRAHVRQRIELDIAYSRLLRSGEQLSTALNPDQLKQNLAEELPSMEINNAFISQYVDADLTQLAPFFCLRQGQVLDPGVSRFPATQLLPPGGDFEGQRRNWFVLPLTFEAEPLGVAVLEFGSGLTVYEMLREQIGTALNNIALHAEIVQKTTLHERSVQERLAANDRMQSLSVLAGGVAHDLNNALGPLVALPDVIIADLDALFRSYALDISAIKADLAVMKSASLRAARTIKDLLTLGRQGHMAKEYLDVNVAVANWFNNESVPSSSQAKRPPKVVLELALEPLTILASESHIVRAVSNLVRNAMEAVDGEGEIRVRTYGCALLEPFTGFEPIDRGDYVVVSVSDTGKGILKQDMPHVFEPFFSKKRLDDGSGSGLGLAIVHGVVKEHNGFVNVESEPGAGARFSLYFRRVEASIAPLEISTVTPVSSAKILLVDDDPVQLRTASRVLTQLGHVVTAIDSGVRACSMLFGSTSLYELENHTRNTPYDVVIMDMLLNEADDGLTVFEKMQSEFRLLRGIIASGHAPTDRTLLAVSRGLIWLAKPYTADALAHSVQLALASRAHRQT